MKEQEPKAALSKYLRENLRGAVILRIEDHFTHGLPDTLIFWRQKGLAIEVKFADPDFKSKGIQELTMNRIALASFAFYVVYYCVNEVKRTYIVETKDIGLPIGEWDHFTEGFDHNFVAQEIIKRMS